MCAAAAQKLISIPLVTWTNLRHAVLGARVRVPCKETVRSLMPSPSLHPSSRFPRFLRLIYSLAGCFLSFFLSSCVTHLHPNNLQGQQKEGAITQLRFESYIWQICQALSVGLNRLKTKQLKCVTIKGFLYSLPLSFPLSLSLSPAFFSLSPSLPHPSFFLSSFPLPRITAESHCTFNVSCWWLQCRFSWMKGEAWAQTSWLFISSGTGTQLA